MDPDETQIYYNVLFIIVLNLTKIYQYLARSAVNFPTTNIVWCTAKCFIFRLQHNILFTTYLVGFGYIGLET